MARADLHTHTHYSADALTTPQRFVARCLAAGLTHVAVTDHGGVDGAYAVRAIAPFCVIVGQEVRTQAGELLALFIEQPIADGLAASEAADHIHAQGGLALAPHPFDRFRPSLGGGAMRRLAGRLDAVEGYNGRTLRRRWDRRARAFAARRALPCALGSDAHCAGELGRSHVDLPDFDGPQELLRALGRAQYHLAGRAPWWLPLSGVALARRPLGRRPPPPRPQPRRVS